jgi:hypothetical protein
VEREVNGKKEQYYQALFRGVLYRFRLPFATEKEVRFGPPGVAKGAYTSRRLERVVLESPEFKRFFEVYGEDQVEARKLLTPRVQEALVGLRRRLGKPTRGGIRGRGLRLAVEGKDRFPRPPILRPVAQTLEEWKSRYQDDLSEASQLVEALRLEEEAKRKGLFLRGEKLSSPSQKHSACLPFKGSSFRKWCILSVDWGTHGRKKTCATTGVPTRELPHLGTQEVVFGEP